MSVVAFTPTADVMSEFQQYIDISNNQYYIVNKDLWTVSDILNYSGDKTAYVGKEPKYIMVLNRDISNQRWIGTSVYPAQPTGLTTLVVVPNFVKFIPGISVAEKTVVDSWFNNYFQAIPTPKTKTKIVSPDAHGFLEWVNRSLMTEQSVDASFNTLGGISVATDEAKKLLSMLQKAIQSGLLGRSDIAV
jgi:hypothetical protein